MVTEIHYNLTVRVININRLNLLIKRPLRLDKNENNKQYIALRNKKKIIASFKIKKWKLLLGKYELKECWIMNLDIWQIDFNVKYIKEKEGCYLVLKRMINWKEYYGDGPICS